MVKVVFEGCCHGALNKIYEKINAQYGSEGVDLVIIGGDFQAIRNEQDLNCLAVPEKFRQMGDFHEYYYGDKKAPYLTILIGGNHEASNYMQELHYGGWVAPNLYYLGYAGVVRYGSLRIGGLSGIYNENHYEWDHIERLPYTKSTERSVYHIRSVDVQKLKLLQPRSLDIMLSHDWPAGITSYGDLPGLLKFKPFFRKDIETGRLGSPPAMDLLKYLQPAHWLSAHLHCRFTATVQHIKEDEHTKVVNPDEIDLDLDDLGDLGDSKNDAVDTTKESREPSSTSFLALDKCLPHRKCIEMLDISPIVDTDTEKSAEEAQAPLHKLQYDPAWLAITKAFHGLSSSSLPTADELEIKVQEALTWIKTTIPPGELVIPDNFSAAVPRLSTDDPKYRSLCRQQPPLRVNEQTTRLYQLLEI